MLCTSVDSVSCTPGLQLPFHPLLTLRLLPGPAQPLDEQALQEMLGLRTEPVPGLHPGCLSSRDQHFAPGLEPEGQAVSNSYAKLRGREVRQMLQGKHKRN